MRQQDGWRGGENTAPASPSSPHKPVEGDQLPARSDYPQVAKRKPSEKPMTYANDAGSSVRIGFLNGFGIATTPAP